MPSDSSQNIWDCCYIVYKVCIWILVGFEQVRDSFELTFKREVFVCFLSSFTSLPNLRAGTDVYHSYRCSLQTDFQKYTANAVRKPGLPCVKFQVLLSLKTNVHVSILFQLILNIDRSVTLNKICIIYMLYETSIWILYIQLFVLLGDSSNCVLEVILCPLSPN